MHDGCDTHDCRNCAKLIVETESWEMPHIYCFNCTAKPRVQNLRSFPFKNTKCEEFVQRAKKNTSHILLSEALDMNNLVIEE